MDRSRLCRLPTYLSSANGNFDISVTYESKDELGSLTKSFKNMTFILETVISDASRLLSEIHLILYIVKFRVFVSVCLQTVDGNGHCPYEQYDDQHEGRQKLSPDF